MKKEIEEIVIDIFISTLRCTGIGDSMYRNIISINKDGFLKPLLIVGNAITKHDCRGYGSAIAILNPDIDLLSEINSSNDCDIFKLKRSVRGRCDLMLYLQMDAYKHKRTISYYRARNTSPAKFAVNASDGGRWTCSCNC